MANLATDKLPADLDLILCSEVLFYLSFDVLRRVAPTIAAALNPGGHLLLAHGNLITDDKTRTGFDWGHPFGATTIGKVFGALDELVLAQELRTPLFTVQLFRRAKKPSDKRERPKTLNIPLPFDLELTPAVEKCILWGGVTLTRDEARQRRSAREVPILMYHSIADHGPAELAPYRISPNAFREQLRYLRRHGFHAISIEEWAAHISEKRPVPGRPVILTFDDGYKDFIENAWPILERADLSATVFIVTDKVGGTADWDELAGEALPLMSWQDLGTLRDKGIEIGSHSASHKDLPTLTAPQVKREGERSRRMLRDRLGVDAKTIAFPWGRHNASVRDALAECGYRFGVATWGGCSSLADDPMNLPRIEIFGDDDIETFAGKLELRATATDAPSANEEPVDLADPIGFDVDEPERPEDVAPASEDRRAAEIFQRMAADDLPVIGERDVAVHPEYARRLAARLDLLIGEFVRLQTQLLNALQAPLTLQKKLTMLFALPVTGRSSRILPPGTEISPGVRLSFAEGAQVCLTIEPKADHSLSPDTYVNTVELMFSGESPWLALEVTPEWSDLFSAERFQLCLYGRPNRTVSCEAALRLPRLSGSPFEVSLAKFVLRSDDRNAVLSGELPLPDFVELDTGAPPQLLLFFDTEAELSLVLHYLNAYFA